MASRTYVAAVNKFVKSAREWLTEEDEPAVTGLIMLARQLDEEFLAATYAQYGLTYRSLLKRKPSEDAGESDPLDDLLDD